MVSFHVEAGPSMCRCSECGSADVLKRGSTTRWFRSVPIGMKLTWIAADLPRVECRQCGVVRQIEIGFARPRERHTKAFAQFALELSKHMTIQDVALQLCVSWDTVKDLKEEYLERHFARPPLKSVRHVAIDEISIGAGHRYLTIVLDLESRIVIFVGEGKGADALLPFWRRVRRAGARIQAVAMDMSAAYISAVQTHLPQAKIVFDHFHVIKLMNEKLTALRRDLYHQAVDQLHKKVLKGTRWLLLMNPEHLCDERQERQRLAEALQLNEALAKAYYLKEDLRQFWSQPDKATARKFLTSWYHRALHSGVRHLVQFARTLMAHFVGLLNYYDFPLSTGPLEGTNNKIKTLVRQSYGLRDKRYFHLCIYALHTTTYALIG
jgi:transposase